MPWLERLEGPDAGRRFELPERTLLGRSARADVRLVDSTVSQLHARISRRGHYYYLYDLESTNGVRVNGVDIGPPTVLNDGDLIELGGCRLRFLLDGAAEAATEDDAGEPSIESSIVYRIDTSDPRLSLLEAVQETLHGSDLREPLESIFAVMRAIARSLAEEDLSEVILRELFALLPAVERGAVLLRTPEGRFEPALTRDRAGRRVEMSFSRTLIREAVDQGQGLLTLDPVSDERFEGSVSVMALRYRSVICVPLAVQDETLGLIQLESAPEKAKLGERDLHLVAVIGGQAGMALSNLRLHESLLRKELLDQDLRLAAKIQQRFLTHRAPDWPPYRLAMRYEPALEIGGDYCDFLPQGDDRLVVVVGDVSGKGIAAALYMAKVCSDVRYLSAGHGDPAEILARVNASLCEDVEEGMFVTMALLLVDRGGHRLRYALAGHPAPLVRSRGGEVRALAGTRGAALGIEPGVVFSNREIELQPGDTVVAFTDGLTEAPSEAGELFGEQRVIAVLGEGSGEPAKVVQRLYDAVRRHGSHDVDDLTLVCLQREEAAQQRITALRTSPLPRRD